MKGLIGFFAGNSVASKLLMLLIFVAGLISIPAIHKEHAPPRLPNSISISLGYPGASPREVEQALCIPIEEAIHDLEGITNIDSTALEGMCLASVEIDVEHDARVLREQIATRIDAVTVFPKTAEKPQVRIPRNTGDALIWVFLYGEVEPALLARRARQLRDDLARLPEVSEIRIDGVPAYEVAIEVPETQLRRYGLTLSEVAAAVRQSALNLPAGALRTREQRVLLQTRESTVDPGALAAIELRADQAGGRLRLGDIAQIRDGFAETESLSRANGHPTVSLSVYPKRQMLETVRQVMDHVEHIRPTLPEGIQLATWTMGESYREMLDIFLGNALGGFGFDVLILALFLRARVALWANAGIAVSFLGALWCMALFGLSLNNNALIAFILVLGLVVDDAVIIGENVLARQEGGYPGVAGAIRGAHEVARPVVLMLACAALGFLPSLFLPGLQGQEIADGVFVILLALGFSFIDSFLILPGHLAHEPRVDWLPRMARRSLDTAQTWAERFLNGLIVRVYRPLLRWGLAQRYVTLALFAGLLLLVGALVLSQRVSIQWWPVTRDYYMQAFLKFPEATPFEEKRASLLRLEQAALDLRAELGLPIDPETLAVWTVLVSSESAIVLNTQDPRWEAITWEFVDRLRARMEPLPPGFSLLICASYDTDTCVADRSPLEVRLSAPDTETLRAGAAALKARLARYAGVSDLRDSYRSGKPELRLRLKPYAEGLGLRLQDLTEQVRASYHGIEVQRLLRGQEEVRLSVRSPPAERGSLEHLHELPLRLASGESVPFSRVAEAVHAPGFGAITRSNRERILTIGARVDRRQGDPEQIYAELEREVFPLLERQYPGLNFHPGKERLAIKATLSALERHTVLAWIAIYGLIAILFRSYVQPIIVMTVMPFGFIGAVIGHMLLGHALSLHSFVGIIAVAGVVLNDSLILVDTVNRRRATGEPLLDIVKRAGEARFRSIFVTALSTFFGLLPLMSEQSIQAQIMIPMAISVAYGVVFAAAISLILVPACFLIQDDLRRLFQR